MKVRRTSTHNPMDRMAPGVGYYPLSIDQMLFARYLMYIRSTSVCSMQRSIVRVTCAISVHMHSRVIDFRDPIHKVKGGAAFELYINCFLRGAVIVSVACRASRVVCTGIICLGGSTMHYVQRPKPTNAWYFLVRRSSYSYHSWVRHSVLLNNKQGCHFSRRQVA